METRLSRAVFLLVLPAAEARALKWLSFIGTTTVDPIRIDGHAPERAVKVKGGDTYDWTKSTADNYHTPGARLRREFLQSRASLDYSYHPRYSLERQATQDEIIRSMLSYEDMQTGLARKRTQFDRLTSGTSKNIRQPMQPWAVFTAGCMGTLLRALSLSFFSLCPLPHAVFF